MASKPTLRAATIGLIVALTFGSLEPAVFAQNAAQDTPTETLQADTATQKALTNKPVILTSSPAPVDHVAQAIAQAASSRIAPPTARTSYVPPARQSSGKSKKWIWIVAAAAGAGITAAILASGDDEETATITIGNPIVGGPQ